MPGWEIFLIVIGCMVGAYIAFVIVFDIVGMLIASIVGLKYYIDDRRRMKAIRARYRKANGR